LFASVLSFWNAGVRSTALVNYLLDCPAARCHLYAVTQRGRTRGYFVLNEVHGQTRIADLAVEPGDPGEWHGAYSLALRTASRLPGTCEVVAMSSLPWLDEVLRHCGMRERAVRPVFVYDPRQLLADSPLHLQMTDSDSFFLYTPSDLFLT
jgi:hypothetical protein